MVENSIQKNYYNQLKLRCKSKTDAYSPMQANGGSTGVHALLLPSKHN